MLSHSRSRKIKTLTNDAGMPIDRKTKQLVFYECDVETVKQVTLKRGDNFSREGANQVFEMGYRKRQSRAILYCLTDRMRFQKRRKLGSTPFRKQLTYREIKHFFVFPSNPNVFMLCIVDESKGKKLYEMFRCRPEDVNTICDLTFKASMDPQNLLRDVSPLRQISMSSRDYGTDTSNAGYDDSRENSLDDLKRHDPSYLAVDYTDHSQADRINHAVQNGYAEESPELFIGGRNSNHRPLTPPRSRSGNAVYPVNKFSSGTENKITGVYSCYDLVEPGKTEYKTVDYVIPMPESPVYPNSPEDPIIESGPSKGYRQINLVPESNRQPAPRSPNATQFKFHHPSPQLVQKNSTFDSNYPMHNGEKQGIKYASQSHRNNAKPRIVIERDEAVNQSIRKFASVQNMNWGDEVTYISYNPVSGTKICDSGPMYMYITRYPSQQNLPGLDKSYRLDGSPDAQIFSEQDDYRNWQHG